MERYAACYRKKPLPPLVTWMDVPPVPAPVPQARPLTPEMVPGGMRGPLELPPVEVPVF
jgi:hypothetical protein